MKKIYPMGYVKKNKKQMGLPKRLEISTFFLFFLPLSLLNYQIHQILELLNHWTSRFGCSYTTAILSWGLVELEIQLKFNQSYHWIKVYIWLRLGIPVYDHLIAKVFFNWYCCGQNIPSWMAGWLAGKNNNKANRNPAGLN